MDWVVVQRLATGVRFLFGARGQQRVRCVGMPGEVDPAFRWIDGTMLAAGLDAGREREACDGVADHLPLAAAEAANGVAHEQNLGEVVAAQSGTAEALTGAELTLNRHTVVGIYSEVRCALV
jgi:hypothetical protein